MSTHKQVNFIERVAKSPLGLEGLQIVVYSDRSRDVKQNNIVDDKYNFQDIGEKLLKTIDGKFIMNKYNIKDSKEFKNRLHEERVKWMKAHK